MPKNKAKTWSRDTAVPFIISLIVAAAFSPWLVVGYSALASYSAGLDPNDQGVIKGFIEWFGAAYSFFLALAIVNVWSQFETVEREFDRELDAIATLLQTVKHTKVSKATRRNLRVLKEFRDPVLKKIEEYLHHVVENYRLEHIVTEQQRNGDRMLENIGEHISTLTSKTAVPEPFIYELFTSLNEAVDVRGDRILHSKPYTPVVVQLVSIVSSGLWLLSFMSLVIYDRLVQIILVGGVAFVIIMVMVIFFDLGEPFGGIWRIHLDEWSEYIETMDHDLDPQVIFVYSLQNTLLGRLGSLTHPETCRLYDFAHAKVNRGDWKKFIMNIERDRSPGHASIKCQSCYYAELKPKGLSLGEVTWPVVALKQGGDRKVIVTHEEIRGCKDLSAFKDLFHQKMEEQLPWYKP